MGDYELIGLETAVNMDIAIDFCLSNYLVSPGMAEVVVAELKKPHPFIVVTDSCECPGVPAAEAENALLFRTDYISALMDAVVECKNNLQDYNKPNPVTDSYSKDSF